MDAIARGTTLALGVCAGILVGVLIPKIRSSLIDWVVFAPTVVLASVATGAVWWSSIDTDKSVLATVAIIAAAGTWYSGLIATRNVTESAKRQLATNTMQALVALETSELVAARQLVRENYLDESKNESEVEKAALLMLDRLEDIASLVNHGVIDGPLCKRSVFEWVDFYWAEVRPTLSPRKVESYVELPKLHGAWKPIVRSDD